MPQVTVGCRLPNGLVIEKGEKKVALKGANTSELIGGHGITEGVDKDFFEAWLADHKDLDFVKNGFVFAHEKSQNASAEAKDRSKNKTGLEPLDPTDKPKGLTELSKD